MTGRNLSLLAGAGSAALLAAALTFQAVGYAPCELCVLQRWPHVAAVAIAGLIWLTGRVRLLALLGLAAALTAMSFGIFHTGVELKLWAGPTHCSGTITNLASMSAQDLMARINSAPVVRCDEVSWRFLGLSMAAWNATLSAVLAVLWAIAAFRRESGTLHRRYLHG